MWIHSSAEHHTFILSINIYEFQELFFVIDWFYRSIGEEPIYDEVHGVDPSQVSAEEAKGIEGKT